MDLSLDTETEEVLSSALEYTLVWLDWLLKVIKGYKEQFFESTQENRLGTITLN